MCLGNLSIVPENHLDKLLRALEKEIEQSFKFLLENRAIFSKGCINKLCFSSGYLYKKFNIIKKINLLPTPKESVLVMSRKQKVDLLPPAKKPGYNTQNLTLENQEPEGEETSKLSNLDRVQRLAFVKGKNSTLRSSSNFGALTPGTNFLKPSDLISLQRTIGNQAVMRLVKSNKFAETSSKGSGLRGSSPKMQSVVQRIPSEIDPETIVAYKQFSSKNSTNAVFMVEFQNGTKIVVKYQGAKATSGEILAGKILENQNIPGINVPTYKILETGVAKGIIKKLKELATNKKDGVALEEIKDRMSSDNYNMLVMDLMENTDSLPPQEKEQVYAEKGNLNENGLKRLRNIGKLYAFQYFILGSDRFITPDGKLGNAQSGNKGNIMLSGETTNIHAIDTTIEMGFHKYGGDPKRKQDYLNTLSSHIDELILNPSGNDRLTKTLEKFLDIKEMDDTGRQEMRAGFLDALKLLSKSTTDIDQLIENTLSLLPKDSDTELSEEKVRTSFTEMLSNIKQTFSQKAEMLEKVDNFKNSKETNKSEEILKLLRIASTLKVKEDSNLDEGDVGFLKSWAKAPTSDDKKRKKQWPNELIELARAKNNIKKGKRGPLEIIKEQVTKIVNLVSNLMDPKNANFAGDFLRISSKLFLRSLGLKY